jgi:hypothetical protein
MFSRTITLLAVAASLLLATQVLAVGPQLINYQGVLTNDQGQPLDGSYALTFKIYAAATGGAALWTEIHTAVPVDGGLFNVLLGGTPFPAGVFNSADRWLGITVGAASELTPRQRFTSVPWAMRATVADTALIGVGGGADNDWTISGSDMYSAVAGNVGIGSTSPGRKLQVGNNTTANAEGMIRLGSRSGTNGSNRLWDIGVPETDAVSSGIGYSFIIDDTQNTTEAEFMVKFGTGYVGIGTTAPAAPLHIVRPVDSTADATLQVSTLYTYLGLTRTVTTTLEGGAINVTSNLIPASLSLNGTSNSNVAIAGGGGDVFLATGGGNVGIGTSSPAAKLDVAGTARVAILEISGADLAEKFPMSESGDPGTVVVIDPDRAGSLRPSRTGYDTRVAGVVSGANGLSVGAVLGQCTSVPGAQAIAMSGRVWTRCDATECAIEPGDLLTTAGRPGHAMKALDPARSHGAIIGKAMTRLARGETGLVLVLINLQ